MYTIKKFKHFNDIPIKASILDNQMYEMYHIYDDNVCYAFHYYYHFSSAHKIRVTLFITTGEGKSTKTIARSRTAFYYPDFINKKTVEKATQELSAFFLVNSYGSIFYTMINQTFPTYCLKNLNKKDLKYRFSIMNGL